jgi:hypothetical protein
VRLLHELPDFADLVDVVGRDMGIDPGLVEKDYWIMHGLWGLQRQGFRFALKGGTSLSKGYGLIDRFSEDIDILIEPDGDLPTGRNQNKDAHIAARAAFYDDLATRIVIPGFLGVERDRTFDDDRMRSAGIRLTYKASAPIPEGVKSGILLETGFDQVAPHRPRLVTSWAYDAAAAARLEGLADNRAHDVDCYEPGYTLVEKLQTISTKYRRWREAGAMPQNFMRHYYDVYRLLGDKDVRAFIGTGAYLRHKARRFRQGDEADLTLNPAFNLDEDTRARFAAAYVSTRSLYFRGQPEFAEMLDRIEEHKASL